MEILRKLVIGDCIKKRSGYIGIGIQGQLINFPLDPKPRSVIRVTHGHGLLPFGNLHRMDVGKRSTEPRYPATAVSP
jgi:hypothetical protein